MKKVYYHATPMENLDSILTNGIRKGIDGLVYLAEAPDEAARFVLIRGCKDILVLEVEVEEGLVEETFDHSQVFFGCRAFGCKSSIDSSDIIGVSEYEII